MNTQELSETLLAFAALAETNRGRELRELATMFGKGNREPVKARLKKLSPAVDHPASLKGSLESIVLGLRSAGASKQATALAAVLEIFAGPGRVAVDAFIGEISKPRPPTAKSKAESRSAEPDHALARELADDLTRSVLETEQFGAFVKRLRNPKIVNTPTLAIVANRFLGNSTQYNGRKNAIEDILRRQKADAREHARNRALSKIGV